MLRPVQLGATGAAGLVAALALGACGSGGIRVPLDSPYHHAAVLFATHCSGCHTLSAAGTHGSASNVRDKLRTNGPNLDQRHETVASVLYAIRNGGFSGAIMPQNIVTGPDAQAVAAFVAKYAGTQANSPPTPAQKPSGGAPQGGNAPSSQTPTTPSVTP